VLGKYQRSWSDKPVMSSAEGLTTNGLVPFTLSLSKGVGRNPSKECLKHRGIESDAVS
jgi:hypothetical protein